MIRKLKVLISAYACEPDKGSEPGVGWNWVKQLSKFHELWVITRKNNRASIEQSLKKETIPDIHWIYFDLPQPIKFLKKKTKDVHIYYLLWQIGIYFIARKLHRIVNFDLTHHITFGNYWMPVFLSLLPIPFIWGPVGGGESTPEAFFNTYSIRGKIIELTRDILRNNIFINPFILITAYRASVTIATTVQSAEKLKKIKNKNILIHPQCGMTSEEINYFRNFPLKKEKTIRFISIGRLIHWKGYHLALKAFKFVKEAYPDSEYWLINDGHERKQLENLVNRLGIKDSVRFWGKLPALKDVYKKLKESDILIHPALHEAFGNVCLEAMAAGRPVICIDTGGPALQVTEETGIKIIPVNPKQTIDALAQAMIRVAKNQELRFSMAEKARKKVAEEFNWDVKGEWMNEIYLNVSKHR